MYKLMLCWRYLRTRWIALASIVSVTLGVATMIVVNSVMAGFSTQMQDRLKGILSDVKIEARHVQGMPDPEGHMELIRKTVGDKVAAMTPTVEVFGMISFRYGGEWQTRPVTVVGIDPHGRAQVGDFAEHLVDPRNRRRPSFELSPEALAYRRERLTPRGYTPPLDDFSKDVLPPAETEPLQGEASTDWPAAPPIGARTSSGMAAPSPTANLPTTLPAEPLPDQRTSAPQDLQSSEPESPDPLEQDDPLAGSDDPAQEPFEEFPPDMAPDETAPDGGIADPSAPQPLRIMLGYLMATYRHMGRDGEYEDVQMIRPGDDVQITVPTAGPKPQPAYDNATVVDYFRSDMSEYDSNFVFVPLEKLQWLRGMVRPATDTSEEVRYVTSIQIKLHDYADAPEVVRKLRDVFKPGAFVVRTWEQQQGPLLAAVAVESGILNVLLFMIIAVAGFGILAIFFMIVVEKTRDIGILKALGASSRGVMGIFLSYGLSLGIVGSGLGMVMGLLFVRFINEIEALVSTITGHKVFDESIYYFSSIPTLVNPFTVAWIVIGALMIAVAASILPARRAARLHPVEALRYDQ